MQRLPAILFLNSPPGTTIGSIGRDFVRELQRASYDVTYREASVGWRLFFRQALMIMISKRYLVVNAGLTNWGRSSIRNFAGFLCVGLRSRLLGRTLVVLHTIIEVIEPQDAGYQITEATRIGAHVAVRSLKGTGIVVFSKVVNDLLRERYGIRAKLCFPIPSEPTDVSQTTAEVTTPLVVFLGHLSRYKGLEMVLNIAPDIRRGSNLKIVGPPHWLLRDDPRYASWLNQLRERAASIGVDLTGYLPDSAFRSLLRETTVGLMPYTSTNGGSASLATFASFGIPVVVSDLPEFRWLNTLGAGILTVKRESKSFLEALETILASPTKREELSMAQRRFANEYSWNRFLQQFAEVMTKATYGTMPNAGED